MALPAVNPALRSAQPIVQSTPAVGAEKSTSQAQSVARVVDVSEARSTGQLEGRFIGELHKPWRPWGSGDMAFLVRKDPKNPGNYYALLAEYNRFPNISPLNEEWLLKAALGKDLTLDTPDDRRVTYWVPRMQVGYLSPQGEGKYELRTMYPNRAGELAKGGVIGSLETKSGQMKDAVLTRLKPGGSSVQDSIKFSGTQASSTWESYVPGEFFWSTASTGFDYFKDSVNVTFSEDRIVRFNVKDDDKTRTGSYKVFEKAPGIFSLKAVDADPAEAAEVEKKVLVFVDVMNWKPSRKTNEALLIDPANPSNLDFLYERGANDGVKQK